MTTLDHSERRQSSCTGFTSRATLSKTPLTSRRALPATSPYPPILHAALQLAAAPVLLEEGVEGGEEVRH
jgi:hypothetical protein